MSCQLTTEEVRPSRVHKMNLQVYSYESDTGWMLLRPLFSGELKITNGVSMISGCVVREHSFVSSPTSREKLVKLRIDVTSCPPKIADSTVCFR